MAGYSKYINSKGTHYISNSGSDENGQYHGGKAGDQTGKEWQLRSWYKRPWTHVFRYEKSKAVRDKITEFACAAALNNKIGYDQYQRTTFWKQLLAVDYNPANIATACEADCSAGVASIVKAVGTILGVDALKSLSYTLTSRNLKPALIAAGFACYTSSAYTGSNKALLPGDILLCENHHVATNITKGVNAAEPKDTPEKVYALGDRLLKNGHSGEDVKELQTTLISLGYDCGKWGVDGDFGDATEMAVTAFQKDYKLEADGEYGPLSHTKLMEALGEDVENASTEYRHVRITGGNCWVRSAPNTSGAKLGVVYDGKVCNYAGETAANGWLLIDFNGQDGWVSGKYGVLEA